MWLGMEREAAETEMEMAEVHVLLECRNISYFQCHIGVFENF